MPSWGSFFTSLFLVVVFECLTLGDKNTDVREGAVTIVFDSVTATAWSKNGTTQRFQKTISEVANGYCSRNTAKCSLKSWNITRTFESSDVVIVSGFPQRRDSDLDVTFYVTYPPGQDFSGNIKAVLPASILEEIVLANKRNIGNAVRATVKSVGVVVVDDDDDGDDKKKADSFMNYLMIPLTVSLLIILCVLACCLQHCKNKQVRAHEAERRQQLELMTQTKAPTTQMEVQVVSGDAHRRKKRRVKRMKKKEKQNEKLDSSDDAPDEPTQANGTTAVTWFEDEEQLSTKGKSIKHKHRKHLGSVDQQPEEPREERRDSAEHNSETKEDIETDEVDSHDQLQKRRKTKRKKHKKRYSHQVDDKQEHAGNVLSNLQPSKLPSIRNLPPLKDRQSVEA